jgi:hypothetical protein
VSFVTADSVHIVVFELPLLPSSPREKCAVN